MKITEIRPWIVDVAGRDEGSNAGRRPAKALVFVEVSTDEGITGWGEITTYPGDVANRAVTGMVRDSAELLLGEDPSRIEALWNKLFRQFTYVGTRGAVSAVVSSIDIALWDIRGKVLGQPVYKLLGGEVRDRIGLYTHPPRPDTPEQAAADAREIVDSGHRALKLDPFWEEMAGKSIAYMDGQISPRIAAKAVEIIAAIREEVGPEIEVLIDAHGNFNVPTAVTLANSLAPYGIHWFEEPVPPESYHALSQVREQVSVPICVGERLHTRFEFLPILENQLADFIMPDVTWTGGISELKKISTMAEAYYVPVSPHDASGPVNVLAGAHVMMTVPNFYKLETSRYRLDAYDAFIDHPLDVRNGDLYLSDRPGLGVELDKDFLEKNQVGG
jgi:galactonate dehydratase